MACIHAEQLLAFAGIDVGSGEHHRAPLAGCSRLLRLGRRFHAWLGGDDLLGFERRDHVHLLVVEQSDKALQVALVDSRRGAAADGALIALARTLDVNRALVALTGSAVAGLDLDVADRGGRQK